MRIFYLEARLLKFFDFNNNCLFLVNYIEKKLKFVTRTKKFKLSKKGVKILKTYLKAKF